MATRNPDLKIPMLLTEPSALRPRSSNAAERKPRFHEDFDAPLLYDLLDASPTSPFADNSSQTSSPRPSLDDDGNAKVPARAAPPPFLQKRNLTSPIIQLQTEWATEPRRRTSVHDKMRKLARRSLVIVRQRPSRLDDELGVEQRPTSGTLTINQEYDLESSEHLQPIVAHGPGPKET
ncbi:hypothetical protein ESCO_000857 [Escovopsis weberi]|uniref:Uncharacterized protein n=1 Tax=Escovopsis weberi TaxID=150374 RepID=A0A0M9VU94_ESCWE|nr:hypothetical protein ESCO_000857 [Escovopsis weberi]